MAGLPGPSGPYERLGAHRAGGSRQGELPIDRGDRATHDDLVVEASKDLRDCDLVALAQYSMAPAAERVAEVTGRPVLTTPDSAVLKLKGMLTAGRT